MNGTTVNQPSGPEPVTTTAAGCPPTCLAEAGVAPSAAPARHSDEAGTAVMAPAAEPAAAARSLPGHAPGRRPELDLMRGFIVAGLVVFHSAVVFAAGTSWFINDPRPSRGFTAFLLWGSLWGMPLLFVISGMSAQHAMRTRSPAALARERLARLLVPFAFGLVVLVPPMFYIARLGQPGFRQPYWRFWLSFLNVPAIARGLLPRGSWTSGGVTFDPAHLWFLYVLLVCSVALLPLLSYLRGPRGAALIRRLAGFADYHGAVVVWAAAIPIMAVEAAFGPDVNTGGWERAVYVFPFSYGFVIASDPRFETALRRSRWPALAVACAATGALVSWAGALSQPGSGLGASVPPGWSALQGLAGWAWIAAIVGFAGSITARPRHRQNTANRPPAAPEPLWRRAARYGNEAVLPFYLLHEPVIVAAAWFIVRWNAPALAAYGALVVVSFAATLAVYELAVRRFRPARLLLGMKPRQPAASERLAWDTIRDTPESRTTSAKARDDRQLRHSAARRRRKPSLAASPPARGS